MRVASTLRDTGTCSLVGAQFASTLMLAALMIGRHFSISALESGERRRRLLLARRDHLADIGEALPHCRIGQGVHDRAVELDDDFLGRALLDPKAMPERNVH